MIRRSRLVPLALIALAIPPAAATLVNWESPHVHPLEMTPNGSRLLAVNTADNRLEVFDLTGGAVVPLASVSVGLDPVSVRARGDDEAWVVNRISDSVSIVDLDTLNVVATLSTGDEPADVVFAGLPVRAFVSCSQTDEVLAFDPEDLAAPPTLIPIDAETPRAMAVSASGDEVYVAIFESGNGSTILNGGGFEGGFGTRKNVVDIPEGPYGGVNPPPNALDGFEPPLNPLNPVPPAVGLIVKKRADGLWLDDNGSDWTAFVSGSRADESGRVVGWDLPDRDLAVIDAATQSVSYASELMNINMALAVNPASGEVTVVGSDATNEIRYEPNLTGTFVRMRMARVDPAGPATLDVADLNPHLDYSTPRLPQEERDEAIGDPRGIVWNQAGTRGYVSGMGSNNVIVIDPSAGRIGPDPTIEVGEGPTGLALDEARSLLYVLNKFDASLSVVGIEAGLELDRVEFFDPTPEAIRVGRKHLYDSHRNSGLGQASCASCHVDGRLDRLAWDLGNPAGAVKSDDDQNLGLFNPLLVDGGFEDFHPMKGPMVTQTFQDIIGKEPHHWRGDKDGLEEFSSAFVDLLGDDVALTEAEMQEFEDFLATIHYPPNHFRNLDNSLPEDLPLPGQFSVGRFVPAGTPLPNGNALRALEIYRFPRLAGSNGDLACDTCHTLPTGLGTNQRFVGPDQLEEIEPGPRGEKHHAIRGSVVDGKKSNMKIPQLRNLYQKVGFDGAQAESRAGFGFSHNGSASMALLMSAPSFALNDVQEVADLVALGLSFSGSDMPEPADHPFQPAGPTSQDTHAAVGTQTTLVNGDDPAPGQAALIDELVALAEQGAVGLVVKGVREGLQRGLAYLGDGLFQSDVSGEVITLDGIRTVASPGSEQTFTVVPLGSETQIGIDRDLDGAFDRDEVAACSDPADSGNRPGGSLDVSGGPITSGEPHTFTVSCGVPGRELSLAYSLDGLGATSTPFGDLGLENAEEMGDLVPDISGVASLQVAIPGGFEGRTLWWQAIDALGNVTDIESTVLK